MATYWMNFSENPNGKGVPGWVAFNKTYPHVMYFQQALHTCTVPGIKGLEAPNAYFKRLSSAGEVWPK